MQGENLVSTRPEAGEQKSSQASPSTPEVPGPQRRTQSNDRPLTGPSLPPPQGEAVGPSQPPPSFGQQRSLLGDESGDATAPSPAQSSVEGKTSRKSSKKSVFPEDLFVPKLCALWNILVFQHGGAQMGVYNAGFENHVRARYTESQKTPYGVRSKLVTLEDWAEFFHHIARSPFLTGQLPNVNGRKPFRISFSWLMKSNENFWKVRRGEYHDRATMRDIGAFSMPDLKGINLDFRGYDA